MLSASVITASFDQGRYIGRTIESVLTQGIALEYLVYDGGSRDETQSILAGYGDRLRWVSERDRGQSHAINKGLAASRGDVIGWLNSDDTYAPGALTAVLDAFLAHPEADAVYGDARYIGESDDDLGAYPVEAWSPERLRANCFLAQPAVFVRRRVIERVGLLDEALHYAMDYEYWLRMVAAGLHFLYLPRQLASCRVHAATKTLTGGLAQSREVFEAQRRHAGEVSQLALRSYVRDLVRERGKLDPVHHPLLHRLVAAPIVQTLTLRHAPASFASLLAWQLRWPLRVLATRTKRNADQISARAPVGRASSADGTRTSYLTGIGTKRDAGDR